MHWHDNEQKIVLYAQSVHLRIKRVFYSLRITRMWSLTCLAKCSHDINRQYFPMSIFSTLVFVTIESSSFHNSIPNLMYVSRRFCIHVILSWRPKNCTGALKNWNLGEKKPVYCLSLISKSYNLSSFEPSLMHVQEGVFKLLYWPNNACSVYWLIYQPTDRWNQYILFS